MSTLHKSIEVWSILTNFDQFSILFFFFYRWTEGKGEEGTLSHCQTGVRHEGQHLPPAKAHLERRLRRLAFLHRRGTTGIPAAQAAKSNAPGLRRLDGLGRLRPLLLVLPSGLAATCDLGPNASSRVARPQTISFFRELQYWL